MYRKRFIPQEVINLRDDVVLFRNDFILVTKWKTINPRVDFASGKSVYWLEKGIKVTKFFDSVGRFLFYYCDVFRPVFCENGDIIFEDLLADVIIEKDGTTKVLDLDEVAEALEKGLIDFETALLILRRLDFLLGEIYAGRFESLSAPLEEV
ncbi:MAG: DUF402 domain-containing protein [Clostridiales bacterium]|nr:DUF402 domain-containing protein [Clostridiales bacterium]